MKNQLGYLKERLEAKQATPATYVADSDEEGGEKLGCDVASYFDISTLEHGYTRVGTDTRTQRFTKY